MHKDILKMEHEMDERQKFPGSWRHIQAQKRREGDKRELTVHLIPTSETLLGFKKSVDEYYTGTN